MEAKKIVDSAKYGQILWLRGVYGKAAYAAYPTVWRSDPAVVGGGILLDQGIHMLDLFRLFCGEFSEIKSMCTTAMSDSPLEDNAFALLRNDDGCIAMIHSSSTQWKHRFTLEIYLEDGYVIVDGQPSTSRSFRDEWLIESRRGEGSPSATPPSRPRSATPIRPGNWSWPSSSSASAAERRCATARRGTPSRRCDWSSASMRLMTAFAARRADAMPDS